MAAKESQEERFRDRPALQFARSLTQSSNASSWNVYIGGREEIFTEFRIRKVASETREILSGISQAIDCGPALAALNVLYEPRAQFNPSCRTTLRREWL